MADRRLDGFIAAWAAQSDGQDLRVLIRSAYLQGLADMAEAAARMTTKGSEDTAQSLEGL